MTQFRLALVEDNEIDIRTCKDSVARYQDEKQRHIELIEYRSVDEALRELDNSFDGAIIDLKFDVQGDEGNQVVREITESNLRIPIVVMTGTPEGADLRFDYIGVFKKGEKQYIDIFDLFWEIHDTGLTRIMGGRGTIEDTLNKVRRDNILPQMSTWVEYGKADSTRTERALLRYILNHLLQLLDEGGDPCYPEEVYLCPPLSDGIKTGSIIKKKEGSSFFVVLSPACDLVIRSKGEFKTDRILLVEIELTQPILGEALSNSKTREKRENILRTVLRNSHTVYYHWLPETRFFPGGFLNFRKLTTLSNAEFAEQCDQPKVQISASFVKDIVARFSSYYARQGQPDIEYGRFVSHFIDPAKEK